MINENKELKQLSIKKLFTEDHYIIPIYQRNYDWSELEITQLIQDIKDVSERKENYYLGTLVVDQRKDAKFEVIDGQQRLTTLGILLSVMKKINGKAAMLSLPDNLNIKFESRENSNKIFDQKLGEWTFLNGEKSNNVTAIKGAYEIIERALTAASASSKVEKFTKYLLENVKILRVSVPEGTDLNHYFEIMNTRGEQLEQHEILKARCLEKLKDKEKIAHTFGVIWDACANMKKYVQSNFDAINRDKIFGDEWDSFDCKNISDLSEKRASDSKDGEETLGDILKKSHERGDGEKDTKGDDSERFSSVIDFPNFLLHVLKIQEKVQEGKDSADVQLDDKQLLDIFAERLDDKEKSIDFLGKFGYNLLKCRYLFDNYIIKRDNQIDENDMGLKKAKKYTHEKKTSINYVNSFDKENKENEKNKQIIMLLAMFHVSIPSQSYKYWLNGALKYLFDEYNGKEKKIKPDEYITYLETLAGKYLYYRIVAKDELKKDYFDIIYNTNGSDSSGFSFDMSQLDRGTAVENFAFNYLDYLLWKKDKDKGKDKNFKFTFRSSVEHFYPQQPPEGNEEIDESLLNNFGNLCLISASRNSQLGNLMPEQKVNRIEEKDAIESIKQMKMAACWSQEEKWRECEIEKHGKNMKDILLTSCSLSKGDKP